MFKRTETSVMAKAQIIGSFNTRWSDTIKIYRFVVTYVDYERKVPLLESKASNVLGFAHAFVATGIASSGNRNAF